VAETTIGAAVVAVLAAAAADPSHRPSLPPTAYDETALLIRPARHPKSSSSKMIDRPA
jgi:hypothetical protein